MAQARSGISQNAARRQKWSPSHYLVTIFGPRREKRSGDTWKDCLLAMSGFIQIFGRKWFAEKGRNLRSVWESTRHHDFLARRYLMQQILSAYIQGPSSLQTNLLRRRTTDDPRKGHTQHPSNHRTERNNTTRSGRERAGWGEAQFSFYVSGWYLTFKSC